MYNSKHSKERYRSFWEEFGEELYTDNHRQKTWFVGENFEDEGVFSLNISAERLPTYYSSNNEDEMFKLTDICWQEEWYHGHNVCSTVWTEQRMPEKSIVVIYNYSKDLILQDAFLEDKYGDCSEGYFSDRIYTLFEEIPFLYKR